MTISQRLIAKISDAQKLDAGSAIQIVDLVLNGLSEAIAEGELINIPGVGTLHRELVAERRDHHASTGVATTSPSSSRVVFLPFSDI